LKSAAIATTGREPWLPSRIGRTAFTATADHKGGDQSSVVLTDIRSAATEKPYRTERTEAMDALAHVQAPVPASQTQLTSAATVSGKSGRAKRNP